MANGKSYEVTVIRHIYREAMPVLFLTALAELFAGFLLINVDLAIENLIGFFILVPGLMQLRGNISTSLAQRLGSATHLGTISWGQGLNKPLRANILAAFLLVVLMSFFLGFGAYILAYLFTIITPGSTGRMLGPYHFILISMGTALLASLFQVTITVLVALISHAKGLDPDNITIPVVAAIGDILTVGCLLLVVGFVICIP